MCKANKKVVAPKTVSADTKKSLALSIPSSISSLKDLWEATFLYPNSGFYTTDLVFSSIIEDKDICSRQQLKEMFGLDDKGLRAVIYEGRRKYDRCIQITEAACWYLSKDNSYDLETGMTRPISFKPSQQKLRALLYKYIKLERFERLMEELEDDYETYILDDIYDDIVVENEIKEEELVDAFQTYQDEHQEQ